MGYSEKDAKVKERVVLRRVEKRMVSEYGPA